MIMRALSSERPRCLRTEVDPPKQRSMAKRTTNGPAQHEVPSYVASKRKGEFEQALGLAQTGKFSECERVLRRIVKKNSNHADALALLGMVRLQRGKNREALSPLNQAIRIDPANASTHSNLAIALEALSRSDKAEIAYQKAIEIDPEFTQAHANLGALLWSRGDTTNAIEHLERAVALSPNFAEAHAALSLALLGDRRSHEALAAAERALAINPNLAKAHWARGSCLLANGSISDAIDCYHAAIQQDPTLAEAYKSLAYATSSALDKSLVAQMSALLQSGDISKKNRRHLHYALAKARDNAGDYGEAFKQWRAGAKLHREMVKWSAVAVWEEYENITAAYDEREPTVSQSRDNSSITPIFIVGMPRSGTTMIEQILATHPAVFAAGETLALGRLIDNFGEWSGTDAPYPQGIAHCTAAGLTMAAENYFDNFGTIPSATYVTDKNLINVKHLGLIAEVFPHARIVYCRRHPLDVIVSCYAHDFTHGMAWSYDLSDTADYYDLFQAYMKHWRAATNKPRNQCFATLRHDGAVEPQRMDARRRRK